MELNTQKAAGESRPHKGDLIVDLSAWRAMERRIKAAATVARSARFEHGETGRVTR